tara:strand:- start:256 stop:531 length:276 start_codon:yes stop_codon:yes gene_type:complete
MSTLSLSLSKNYLLKQIKGGHMSRETGTVKWFNNSKGFGFIAPDNGDKDLFVHFQNIAGEGFKSLNEGDKVEYDIGQGPKGDHATEVTVVN